ncbi:MAG: hypothetical protein ACOX4F_08740 [Atopobiaceae bacterium]
MKKDSSILRVIGFCGSCIAFYIGAGFATMQEVMQYEASYGSLFMVVILVAAAIYVYTNLSFTINGHTHHLEKGSDIFTLYCGKYVGTFFKYFTALFCYMCFIVMCGGANSTATQQWGLPNGVGAVVLTVFVVLTAVFGLNGIVNALGKVGPIIIVCLLGVAIVTAISGAPNFAAGLEAVDSGKYEIAQVGGGNPFASGASYGGFVILWFSTFLAELGAKNDAREVNRGVLISTIFIFATAAICCVALISHIDITATADIPTLMLANTISPIFAHVLSFIIFCGIYTTAVPLLWGGISGIAREGTPRYKILIVVGGIIGCAVACFLPYRGLVNVLYGLNGYLGFLLIAFMIVFDIRSYVASKKQTSEQG